MDSINYKKYIERLYLPKTKYKNPGGIGLVCIVCNKNMVASS